ncbi:PAS domain S-box protein [Methanoregula sp.]|uniref:response regulator n=1 Tax=Methanoregula sp. TaxID=2052170 RepID=UPI003BAE8B99
MFSVLYVDDESNILEVTKLYLEVTGEFSVDTRQSVKDGLDALKIKTYNAVVSDFQMPGTDGIEFLKIVRSTFGDIPFILFTGKGREDVAIQALDNGVDFYIQKGEDTESQLGELRNKIKMAVDQNNTKARINFEQRTDLFNSLPDAAFSIDKRGVVIAWNKAIEELTGVSAVDMFGKDNYEYALPFYGERCPLLIDLVFKPDAKIEDRYTNIVRDQGTVITGEARFAKPRGDAKILSCKAVPVYDNKGNVIGAIESMCDITPQKTAEHALQESEVRLQRAELIAHVGHWQIDLSSGTMIYSEGAGTIYGLKNLVQPVKAAQQIPLPEYRNGLDEALRALIAQGKPYNVEYKIQRANDWALRDIHSIAAYDAEHRVVFGVIQDITERKIAEKILRESEGRFRSIVENSPESILIIDLQGTILFSNSAAIQTIEGNDFSSLIGRNIIEFISPESRGQMAKDFSKLSRGEDATFACYSVITAQGRKRLVESIGKSVVFEGKTTVFLSVREVTDRKLSGDLLQENGDQLVLAFNAIEEGMALHEIIFDTDKKASDYRVLAVNDSFERQLDINRADVAGKTSREAYATTEPPYLEVFARVADTGKPETFETWFAPLQKYFRISVYSPRKNQFVTVFYDISERKMAEDAVRQANIQLNLMTSITRHDILNKVSALIGYYGIIRLKFPNPALTYYISKLEDTTHAIQSLIMDTQTYQNIGIREPQWQDLDKIVRRLQIPEMIKLTVDLRSVQVYADPMLEKVFFNLMDNSIRHGGHVTEIRVAVSRADEGLVVVWEDNGTGIPGEDKDKIFEKGYGVNTGLGLPLCSEILAITGISLRETGEPGKGARFEIVVPKGAYRLNQMTVGEKEISIFPIPTSKS